MIVGAPFWPVAASASGIPIVFLGNGTVGVARIARQVRQDGRDYGVVLPMILGNDPSGVVMEVGIGVEHLKVNDRVAISQGIHCQACPQCLEGNPSDCGEQKLLGVHLWGGYAEYVKVPATNCVPIPNGISFAEATVV